MINNQRGFTLVEFLVAIVILMVGLLGMLQAINIAMDKNLETVFRTEGIMLAESEIMRIKAGTYDSIATPFIPSSSVTRFPRGIMKNYSVVKTVRQPTSKSKQLRIDVKWRKKNTTYSQTVETIVSTRD